MFKICYFVVGFCLYATGAKDCGLSRLQPSEILADTEYSSSYPVENLIDDSYSSYWYSGNGDTTAYVYFDFSNDVDIKHIMVREGTYYLNYIYVYDANSGVTMDYTQSADTDDYKIYNFWFPEWVTNRVKILFQTATGSYITVSTVSFWGCNETSTVPTSVPTISPTKMPTNSTPTALPTITPSASPTELPTTSIPSSHPTTLPSVSPSQLPTQSVTASPSEPPSIHPTLSPSIPPTTTLVPSSSPTMTPTSSLLPTSSPSLYPTSKSTPIPDDGSFAESNDSDGESFISIGVLEILIVLILGLVIAMICLCWRLQRGGGKFPSLHVLTMEEANEQPDRL